MMVLLVLLILPGGIRSQDIGMEPKERLTISEGLSHNGVSSMLTDSRGYLWVATFDGLNRYDGNSVDVFQNLPSKKLLVSNRIRSLSEDDKGNLILGTDEGLSVYHYEEDRFETIYANETQKKGITGPIIRKVILLPETGTIIAVTEESGLLIFDRDYHFIKQCIPTGLATSHPVRYFSGCALDDSLVLLATTDGLLLFDVNNGHFEEVLPDKIASSLCVLKVAGQHLLVGTISGVHLMRYSLGEIPEFWWERKIYSGDSYSEIAVDNRRNLWLGTLLHGVTKVSTIDALLAREEVLEERFASNGGLLRSSSFAALGKDDFWVGSFDKGAFRFSLEPNPFYNSLSDHNEQIDKYLNNLSFITPVDRHRMLISGTGGPIRYFNTLSQQYEPLPASIANIQGVVQDIHYDSRGDFWYKRVGTNEVFRMAPDNLVVTSIRFEDFDIPDDYHFFQVTEDRSGNYWLVFQEDIYQVVFGPNNEVQRLDALSDNPELVKSPIARIRAVYVDPIEDILWIGTNSNGLYGIPVVADRALRDLPLERYQVEEGKAGSLTSNFVSSIIRLTNGELWLGTERGGVCRFNGNDAALRFTAFTTEEGLTNNVVKSMLSDDSSNLWIGTNSGLNKLVPTSGKITTYRKQDGLPFDDFYYSAKRMKNGTLVFSGVRGFTAFRPENLPERKEMKGVQFGGLKLFNRSIAVGDTVAGRVLLEHRLQDGTEIAFSYGESVFSVEVDPLHFGSSESHYLSYKLMPENEDWLKLPPNQWSLNFNNLSAGEYELLVRSCKVGGDCSEASSLYLDLSPPWWKSLPAFLLYAFLFLLLGVVILYSVLRFQKLRHAVEIEHLEREAAKKLNAEKLRFFSNISHEIKTPISLIYGPVQLLLRRFARDKHTSESLELIERQAKKISRLVDEVQDFQKADANLLQLSTTTFILEDFLAETTRDLIFLAKSEGKSFVVQIPEMPTLVRADKDKLEKITDNLISNALKHTVSGDEVGVMVEADAEIITLTVSDTGRGIPPEALPMVFDRFYQVDNQKYNATTGSGIGLAFTKRLVELHQGTISIASTLGEGTTVTVKLPVVDTRTEGVTIAPSLPSARPDILPALILPGDMEGEEISLAAEYHGKKIFLVEDNHEMRRFVNTFLENYFKVTSFTTGRECLDGMAEEWPDLVVSDVQMPDMNGLELCAAIKEDLKTSHIPVILLTAFGRDDDRIKGIEYGADGYIRKPFRLQLLLTTIEGLLRNRKQLLQRFKIDFPLTLEKESAEDNRFLERLYGIMLVNLDNNPNPDLDSFAKKLLLNRTHFYQKVKKITGLTPYELMKTFRLKRAAELLVQDGLTVNEAYVATGFKSRSNFSKAFKKQYGVPPSQYAAESQNRLEKEG